MKKKLNLTGNKRTYITIETGTGHLLCASFFIDYYYLFHTLIVVYPTYGLKGQKHSAQGKANNVSRHPGYSVSAFAWRPERAKDLRRYAENCTINMMYNAFALSGREWWCGILPRVSLPVVACPGLGDVALSGREWWYGVSFVVKL